MPRKRTRYPREEVSAAIDRWVLNEQHRQLLRRRLIDHPTIATIAEEAGLDDSTVKRIFKQYRDVLGEYM